MWRRPQRRKLLSQASRARDFQGKTAHLLMIGQIELRPTCSPSDSALRPVQSSFAKSPQTCPFAKATPQASISPPPNCTSLQLLSFRPLSSDTSSNMFRNALRQSTRAVGAASAAGRVAAVSLLTWPSCGHDDASQPPIESPNANILHPSGNDSGRSIGLEAAFFELFRASLGSGCGVALPQGYTSANFVFLT